MATCSRCRRWPGVAKKYVRDNALWTCVNDAANPGGGIRHRDWSTGKSYVAKGEQLGRFVLFTITEVPDIMFRS